MPRLTDWFGGLPWCWSYRLLIDALGRFRARMRLLIGKPVDLEERKAKRAKKEAREASEQSMQKLGGGVIQQVSLPPPAHTLPLPAW